MLMIITPFDNNDRKRGRGVTKYFYILIISYNVQEYEMKTRYKMATFQK